MKVGKIFFFCMLALFIANDLKALPQVPPAAATKVCSAIIYDLNNEAILFEQNADEKIPPASLTKILSMFLGMDHLAAGKAALDDKIVVSPMAASVGGSRMGLRPNEQVSFKKLLMGMAVSSGNDASHALAEAVGGTSEAFVKMMNARCQNLGMQDSNFVNPHGLPAKDQYTTARDMLTLARAYLKAHPYALAYHNTLVLDHAGYRTWNKNPLLGQYPGADGLKSGWIRASGYNLVFTATRDNRRLLAVILGAPDTYIRSAEACRLLDAAFMVCNNEAVSVAAALENLPVDLNRIDPRKTAKDHGIGKTRYLAANAKMASTGNGRRTISAKNGKILLVKKKLKKGNAFLAHASAHSLKSHLLAGKALSSKLKAKSNARIKSHAERRTIRSKRS